MHDNARFSPRLLARHLCQRHARLRRQHRPFARGAAQVEAVHPIAEVEAKQLARSLFVQLFLGGKRRDERGENAGELYVLHGFTSPYFLSHMSRWKTGGR